MGADIQYYLGGDWPCVQLGHTPQVSSGMARAAFRGVTVFALVAFRLNGLEFSQAFIKQTGKAKPPDFVGVSGKKIGEQFSQVSCLALCQVDTN